MARITNYLRQVWNKSAIELDAVTRSRIEALASSSHCARHDGDLAGLLAEATAHLNHLASLTTDEIDSHDREYALETITFKLLTSISILRFDRLPKDLDLKLRARFETAFARIIDLVRRRWMMSVRPNESDLIDSMIVCYSTLL